MCIYLIILGNTWLYCISHTYALYHNIIYIYTYIISTIILWVKCYTILVSYCMMLSIYIYSILWIVYYIVYMPMHGILLRCISIIPIMIMMILCHRMTYLIYNGTLLYNMSISYIKVLQRIDTGNCQCKIIQVQRDGHWPGQRRIQMWCAVHQVPGHVWVCLCEFCGWASSTARTSSLWRLTRFVVVFQCTEMVELAVQAQHIMLQVDSWDCSNDIIIIIIRINNFLTYSWCRPDHALWDLNGCRWYALWA